MRELDIDGLKFPFDTEWSRIAISLSGGADSALLAYLICSFTNVKELHCISHTRMWKTRPVSYTHLTLPTIV